jgi:hypothetical protein
VAFEQAPHGVTVALEDHEGGKKEAVRATYARDRWGFLISAMGAFGYTAEDITPERAIDIIRLAAGVPKLDVTSLGIAPWVASARSSNSTAMGASSSWGRGT